jgi:hypothetical protein
MINRATVSIDQLVWNLLLSGLAGRMTLFDIEVDDADLGYKNILLAKRPTEAEIKERLEALWLQYEPYADTNFRESFARDPDPKFWEMYLTVQMLAAGKDVRPRSELPIAQRNIGPDIKIIDDGHLIWIEAIAPESGADNNPDRVPEIISLSEGGGAQSPPRREVELRITSALETKRKAFARYQKNGLVSEEDICIVAISGSRFSVQSALFGMSRALSAVLPIGELNVSFGQETGETVNKDYYDYSKVIERTGGGSIPRNSFFSDRYPQISGLIWSRRSIGDFCVRAHDLTFIHNTNPRRKMEPHWTSWAEEWNV